MITVKLSDDKIISFAVEEQQSVLEAVSSHPEISLSAPCGGNGLCGNCKIKILSGDAGVIHPDEHLLLSKEELASNIRLGCRTMVDAEHPLSIALESSEEKAQVRTSFSLFDHPHEMFKKCDSLQYGCAIDIGTTTMVVYLVRLDTHQIVGHRSGMNRQRSYGGDVISRIQYASEGHLNVLQTSVVNQLESMIISLLDEHQLSQTLLREIVAVGNPTMIHLLVGKDPTSIAAAPYTPSFTEELRLNANDVGFSLGDEVQLFLPGLVSGYIGSDITAGLAASRIAIEDKSLLFIDIGTNGEIVLWNGKEYFGCSSAAGPAFEGASIRQGLGAIPGAIDSVIVKANESLVCTTIGGEVAKGICGSGIIDTVAALLELGLVDETGAMDTTHPLFTQLGGEGPSIVLAHGVAFTAGDVREVQLAKAAIAAGIETLLERGGVEPEKLSAIYIAGGFGSYINVERAQRIGLLPNIDPTKVLAVGNAAGKGALEALMLSRGLEEIEKIREGITYIELSALADFQNRFVEQMFFPEV